MYNCPSPNQYQTCKNGVCCAQETNYCVSRCENPCTGNDKNIHCWESYSIFESGGSELTGYPKCQTTSASCGTCIPLTDTCGGNAFNCPGITTGDPDSVSHIDNCNNVYCGSPCITPTPGGPSCIPDCSCAANICLGGGSCSDGCNGTCLGFKACSGTLTARAVAISSSDTSCNAVTASTNYLTGTDISFSPAVNPVSQTQAGNVLTWSGVTTNGATVYTVSGTPPSLYTLANACVSQNGGPWSQYRNHIWRYTFACDQIHAPAIIKNVPSLHLPSPRRAWPGFQCVLRRPLLLSPRRVALY